MAKQKPKLTLAAADGRNMGAEARMPVGHEASTPIPYREEVACPFCGTADALAVTVVVREQGESVRVDCDVCGAHGPEHESREDALVAWRERAVLPQAAGILDHLNKALRLVHVCAAHGDLHPDVQVTLVVDVVSELVCAQQLMEKGKVD